MNIKKWKIGLRETIWFRVSRILVRRTAPLIVIAQRFHQKCRGAVWKDPRSDCPFNSAKIEAILELDQKISHVWKGSGFLKKTQKAICKSDRKRLSSLLVQIDSKTCLKTCSDIYFLCIECNSQCCGFKAIFADTVHGIHSKKRNLSWVKTLWFVLKITATTSKKKKDCEIGNRHCVCQRDPKCV